MGILVCWGNHHQNLIHIGTCTWEPSDHSAGLVTKCCLEQFMSSGTRSFSGAVSVTCEATVCFEILLKI